MTPEEQHILAVHKQQTQALRRSVKDAVEALWDSLPSHNRNMIPEFLEQVIPLVEAQQQQMAAVTEMYLRQSAIAQGTEIGATAPMNVSTRALRHVPATEVYERPFTEVYRLLKEGKDLQDALDAGKRRLVSLAHTGLQLAKTHTSQNLLGGSGFVGYRRVLVGPYNCGLCIVASTQRYYVGDLQPIHPGCDCTVAAFTADKDPGWVINREQLANVHKAMADTFGSFDRSARGFTQIRGQVVQYRDVTLTRMNSELGPVLTVASHHHRAL